MNIRNYLLLLLAGIALSSCTKRSRSLEFMPDMYYTIAYDPYQEAEINARPSLHGADSEVTLFKENGNMTALLPVKGTVPREGGIEYLPYDKPNTPEALSASKSIKSSPLPLEEREADLVRGRKMYEINCAICHGTKGDGKGPIKVSGKYNGPVPNYKDKNISVGSVYHVIMHGKNAMGSYASQLQPQDRWRVAEYVLELKNK